MTDELAVKVAIVHQTAVLRAYSQGDRQHLVGHRHLEVHARLDHRADRRQVLVLDMASIFTQMQRDAVGARLLGHERSIDRIRIAGAPCLAQRGDVIDIYAQRNPATSFLAAHSLISVGAAQRALHGS